MVLFYLSKNVRITRILFLNFYLFSPVVLPLSDMVFGEKVNYFHPGYYLLCEKCRIAPYPAWCLD